MKPIDGFQSLGVPTVGNDKKCRAAMLHSARIGEYRVKPVIVFTHLSAVLVLIRSVWAPQDASGFQWMRQMVRAIGALHKQVSAFCSEHGGGVGVTTALILPVLVGFIGLGIDTANWYSNHRQAERIVRGGGMGGGALPFQFKLYDCAGYRDCSERRRSQRAVDQHRRLALGHCHAQSIEPDGHRNAAFETIF